jgi:hypothetical protein
MIPPVAGIAGIAGRAVIIAQNSADANGRNRQA